MARSGLSFSRLNSLLTQEVVVCVIIGIPALGYVLATNETASRSVILLHAALLVGLVPLSMTLVELLVPRVGVSGWAVVGRELSVRIVGLVLAILGTLAVIASLTPLTLRALVGSPLAVAMIPVFLAYGLATMVVQWARFREQALLASVSEVRARHAALAARIRPHFLFNALNCIEELTELDPPGARIAVGRLANLFRAVLKSSAEITARVEDEIRLVEDYLGIEQIRLGQRFRYTIRLSPEASTARLPGTILLTLAENAMKHGCEATPGPVELEFVAEASDGRLHLSISGPAAPASPERGTGYGLSDVRERLALAYGDRASLTLTTAGGRSRVDVITP